MDQQENWLGRRAALVLFRCPAYWCFCSVSWEFLWIWFLLRNSKFQIPHSCSWDSRPFYLAVWLVIVDLGNQLTTLPGNQADGRAFHPGFFFQKQASSGIIRCFIQLKFLVEPIGQRKKKNKLIPAVSLIFNHCSKLPSLTLLNKTWKTNENYWYLADELKDAT